MGSQTRIGGGQYGVPSMGVSQPVSNQLVKGRELGLGSVSDSLYHTTASVSGSPIIPTHDSAEIGGQWGVDTSLWGRFPFNPSHPTSYDTLFAEYTPYTPETHASDMDLDTSGEEEGLVARLAQVCADINAFPTNPVRSSYRSGDRVFHRPCSGPCHRAHYLQGSKVQLHPCAFFDRCLGGVSPNSDSEFVYQGVLNGFQIVDGDFDGSYFCGNYDSITTVEFKSQMDNIVNNELLEGNIMLSSTRPSCVHAMGAIRKKYSKKLRPITDAKRPLGRSINNFMLSTAHPFTFVKLDTVAGSLVPLGFMSVVDIRSAYRAVRISPEQRPLQGFVWDVNGVPEYIVDCSLSFGLACAPSIFNSLTQVVVREVGLRGVKVVYGYLDDFIVMGDSYDDCVNNLTHLVSVLVELGFSISWDKLVLPSRVVTYLGIEISSVDMQLRLGSDKVDRISSLVDAFLLLTHSSLKDLQILSGHLAHASVVVRGGRTFSRRLINLIKFYPKDARVVRLPDWLFDDLRWWSRFLPTFNGKAKIIPSVQDSWVTFYSDASGTGFGAHYETDWLFGSWDSDTHDPTLPDHHMCVPPGEGDPTDSSNLHELWPVVAAALRWGPLWSGRRVILYTDNTQVQAMVNTGRSTSIRCMWWVRELFWISVVFNFHMTARRITTHDNVAADFFSRLFDSRVRQIPPSLLGAFCCIYR